MIKISIITPSFNQGQFIEQTIESILSQNYPNLEYIVMDGGSTDNTVEILKKYEGKLKWFSEKDKGQSDAINKGLKMATGDIVAWLNSDDCYLPGTLEKVAQAFSNESIQWVTGDYKIVDEKGKEIHSFVRGYKNFLRSFPFRDTLYIANYINQPSTFWRRNFQEKVGYLNEDLHFCMDYDLWLRFMKLSHPVVIFSPLSAFRIHSTSKGKKQFATQFKEEIEVANIYGANLLTLFLHKIHSFLVTLIYNVIK